MLNRRKGEERRRGITLAVSDSDVADRNRSRTREEHGSRLSGYFFQLQQFFEGHAVFNHAYAVHQQKVGEAVRLIQVEDDENAIASLDADPASRAGVPDFARRFRRCSALLSRNRHIFVAYMCMSC